MTSIAKTQSLFSRGYLFFEKFSQTGSRLKSIKVASFFSGLKNLKNLKSKKILIFAAIIVLIIAGVWFFRSSNQSQISGETTYVAEGPRAQLNKRFEVPIKDSDGKEVGSVLVVNVTYLERTGELIYQGRRLLSKEGKDFIVINLEVENATGNRLTVRPVDFFRLIDANGKSYAPDIQTDPVKVEPKSSKRTRTIYIVGDDQKILTFMIGEIKGGKFETVEVAI